MTKAIWGLEKFDLFRELTANDIQTVTQIADKKTYEKGDIITDQNSKAKELYLLIDGKVDIISPNGIQLYRITNGETFGELALAQNIKRTAIAVAREKSVVLVLNMSHLDSFGIEYPEIYKTLTNNIVKSLGIKLARANKLIELLKSELIKNLRK
ncbi:Crp/Fnr family transcriptional regulator [Candidatus Latescibacterota bacterium]